MKVKPQQAGILAAGGIILATWLFPVLRVVLLPLQYLYTHLHEMGHAIVALGTGASGIRIVVHSDGSGVTTNYGGIYGLISPAGYIGATAFGALMIVLSKHEKGARTAFGLLGGILAFECLFWLRGDSIGLITGFGYAGLLLLAAFTVRGQGAVVLAQFLGLYQCLSSLQAIAQVLHMDAMSVGDNDTMLLQKATGIPAMFSAVLWSGISLFVVFWTLRYAWSGPRAARS